VRAAYNCADGAALTPSGRGGRVARERGARRREDPRIRRDPRLPLRGQPPRAPTRRLVETLPSICRDFEILIVEDGGGDGSWEVIRELGAPGTPGSAGSGSGAIFGQHNALLCGHPARPHQVIVTLDDDLQNPPEEIPRLLARLAEGYDVVYGTPREMRHGLWRNLASRITKLALRNMMGPRSRAA